MTGESTFRVTVRGQFVDLTDDARTYLARARDDHEIFKSAYTTDGTLAYDDQILFFSFRIEVRAADADTASELGRAEAEMFLNVLKFGHRINRVTAADMSDMWPGESSNN